MSKRIVFLYTELAEYIKVCLDQLAESGVEVHVFAYPVNEEAPFQFDFENSPAQYYQRNEFSNRALEKKVETLSPQVIVCSGWVDKGYVSLCRNLKKDCLTVLAMDTQLEKGIKPRFSLIRAKLFYKSAFSAAWVPGAPQSRFAKKLGFTSDRIFTGFYTANTEKWTEMGRELPKKPFPKRFVYVGRYIGFKGIEDLWNAFEQLNSPDWELFCAGQGELFPHRRQSEGIHHLGFVQPADLDKFVALGGVFILPSHREPWGVVLHEFAAAGYPLICSARVGAATAFLKEEENGYLFRPGNVNDLVSVLKKIVQLPENKLIEMSQQSKKMAAQITIDKWLTTAKELLELEK